MSKKILMIDAFSTLHVGNGALIDNTYKLCKKYLGEHVEVLSIDSKTNIGRFPIVIDDIFSVYGGSALKKFSFSIFVFLFFMFELINITCLKSSMRLPWPKRYRDFLDAVDRCDICVSLSGETINDYYYPHMYLRLLTYYLAVLKGKEFILFPQSIGPVFRPFSKFLLRKVFGNIKAIIARDKLSLSVARELWGDNGRILFSPDVAVTQESEKVDINGFSLDKKIIGLTVSDIPKNEMGYKGEYLIEFIDNLSDVFPKETYAFFLMPSNYRHVGYSGDYKFSLKAMDLLNSRGYEVKILPNKIIHPDEYQGLQKSLFAFVSTRMHVGILATSAAIPTVMINTQHKIKAYMNLMDVSEYVIELSDISHKLKDALQSLIENNLSLRNKLKANNLELRSQVDNCLSSLM